MSCDGPLGVYTGQDNPARLSPVRSITAAKVRKKKDMHKGDGDFFADWQSAEDEEDGFYGRLGAVFK